jgi:hypothetical protein
MMRFELVFLLLVAQVSVSGMGWVAQAALGPDAVRVADGRKTEAYVKDGVVVGGDRAITHSVVRDIRRADNSQYERVVIDLEGTMNGEPAAVPRPPFFQAAITPDERRIVLSIWGQPELKFDSARVLGSFKKSRAVSKVELLPKVDDQVWSFALNLRTDARVEVFELGAPTRIILDIRSDTPKSLSAHAVRSAPRKKSVSAEPGPDEGHAPVHQAH